MAKDYPRSYRVADQIQRELSGIIRFGVKDPRVPSTLTIAGVEVSKDLSSAKVFVSMFGMEEDQEIREEAVIALNKASGYLRRQLGSRMRLRIVPTLHFRYDSVQEDAVRMSSLIDDAVRSNTTPDDSAEIDPGLNRPAGDA
ncbi:ribosome-binding factor A [Chromatiales bacterium (ex Bugula neritina AB1)]|nr:ribosome-binding factor A [Chromatiales bacterium (ex Bugula neritina AB1)]